MVKIEAVIQPHKLEEATAALAELDYGANHFSAAAGCENA
jgi:nitrogen regulatory protein PII